MITLHHPKYDYQEEMTEHLDTVWDALAAYREDLIPEGDPMYDAQWAEICEAMANIRSLAGLDDEVTQETYKHHRTSQASVNRLARLYTKWVGYNIFQDDPSITAPKVVQMLREIRDIAKEEGVTL